VLVVVLFDMVRRGSERMFLPTKWVDVSGGFVRAWRVDRKFVLVMLLQMVAVLEWQSWGESVEDEKTS
jgi:hypothetical protein